MSTGQGGQQMQDQTRVGRFTFDTQRGTWTWDDEVFRIHGLAPGAIEPTTDYILRCKHPEEGEQVASAFAQAASTGEPLSVSYRLLAADGVERKVVVVCEGGVCQDDGPITSVDGYFIDLTADFLAEAGEAVREAVEASAAHRASIEQAKGALMLAYGVDPEQAFAMLRWWSRNKNVKVRDLSERLVEAVRSGGSSDADLRISVDALLHDLAVASNGSAPASADGGDPLAHA